MKSVQMGSWKALNETAKNYENHEISQRRRQNWRSNANGFLEGPQRNCENCEYYKNREKWKISLKSSILNRSF